MSVRAFLPPPPLRAVDGVPIRCDPKEVYRFMFALRPHGGGGCEQDVLEGAMYIEQLSAEFGLHSFEADAVRGMFFRNRHALWRKYVADEHV